MIIKNILIFGLIISFLGIIICLLGINRYLKIDQFERIYFLMRKVQNQIDIQTFEKRKGQIVVTNNDVMITFANRKRAREYVMFLGEKALHMMKVYPNLACIERISIIEMEIQDLIEKNRSAKWMD